jgi:VanZ family protein
VPASYIPNFAALTFLSDKFVHALIYFSLAYIGLNCYFNLSNTYLLVFIFSFGLIIEIVHYYHPNRFFEIADLIANLLGILFALFLFKKKIV